MRQKLDSLLFDRQIQEGIVAQARAYYEACESNLDSINAEIEQVRCQIEVDKN